MIAQGERAGASRTRARRWLAGAAYLAALGGIVSTQSGCEVLLIALVVGEDDGDDPPPATWDDSVDPAVAPEVEIAIADWPPIGPAGEVLVHASADNGLASANLEFHNATTLWSQGNVEETFVATGTQLGEGFGDLTVVVTGTDGAFTESYVDNLLVDLTPPEIVLGPTTLPAGGGASFDFWMGDAWVLSKAEMTFGGQTMTEELPIGYPTTLGVEWDYSLVRFDVSSLPAITDVATLTVTDAAGNVTVQDVFLTIDGSPPTVSVVAPSAGEEVSGDFEVEVEASDAQSSLLLVDLYAGGSIVATGSGPECTFVLSADELAEGPLELEAVATDEAGNRSIVAHVNVVVAHAPPPDDGPPDELEE